MNENNLNANNGMGTTPQPNVNPQVPTDNLGLNQNNAFNSVEQTETIQPTNDVQPTEIVQENVVQQQVEPQPNVVQPDVTQPDMVQNIPVAPTQTVDASTNTETNVQSVTPEIVASTNVAVESSVSPLGTPIQPTNDVQQTSVAPTQPQNIVVDTQQASVAPTQLQNTTTTEATITPNNTLNQMNNTGTAFVPTGEPGKKKNKLPIIIAVIAVLLIVGGLVVHFFIGPKVQKEVLSDPKNVYDTTITNLSKEINKAINDANYEKVIFDLTLSLDSDIEMLKDYIGYEYGIRLGVDPKNELLELGANVKKDNELSLNAYYKNKKLYANLSTYQELIDLGEVDMSDFEDLLKELEDLKAEIEELNLSKDDINYLVTKFSSLIIDSIDTSKLTQEEETIKIKDEEIKVTSNKYLIDYENAQRTIKFITQELAKDDKVLEILAKISGEEKDVIKENLLKEPEENTEIDEETKNQKIYVSIYTHGNKNDIIGYSLKEGNNELHYYSLSGNFEILYAKESYDYETEKDVVQKFIVTGTKNNDVTDVVINVDETKLAELSVREFSAEKVDFDYTIILDKEVEIKGYVKYSANANGKKDKYNL